mmetsp:Transcript_62259/g.148589  ORF Transcript_62259/g.148589 Transcript_62259/m.148589 type:complete len:97 (+) Transcript_62259:222-512(+)
MGAGDGSKLQLSKGLVPEELGPYVLAVIHVGFGGNELRICLAPVGITADGLVLVYPSLLLSVERHAPSGAWDGVRVAVVLERFSTGRDTDDPLGVL